MKYSIPLIVLLLNCFQCIHAQDRVYPKLSPNTQEYLLDVKDAGGKVHPLPNYVYKNTTSGIYMSAMIKVSAGFSSTGLDQLGVHVGTKAGLVWTVQIPIANVEAATKVRGIDYFELDVPTCLKLDSVRKVTHVDSVHQGINLPMPYAGMDVVVGVVDVGFDFTHPTFRDTTGKTYRIKRAWLEKTSGTPPTGFNYGSELTDSASIWDAHSDNVMFSHGTHVTGMAAGSGFGSSSTDNRKYRGMAYEADIVLVGIMPDSLQWQNTGISDIVDGINYIYKYATSVGKPAIVNLSWGSVVGPHDGTSLFSQAVDALTGPGKIFAVSAGNEGDEAVHLQKTFTATDTVVNTFVGFDANLLPDKNTWLDIWGQTGKTFCVKAALYDSVEIASTAYVCLDNSVHRLYLIGSNGDTCTVTLTTSTSEFNGKPRVYVSLVNKSSDSVCLSVKSTDGTVNLWNGYIRNGEGYFGLLTNGGRTWATGGDSAQTVSDLVSTPSAIGVGAFASKVNFHSITGPNYTLAGYATLGHLAPFSSQGPTADGRIKPDIAGPGLLVVSSVNSYDTSLVPGGSGYTDVVSKALDSVTMRTHYYAQFSGTSMSCPATSGIIALMLQVNPNLNPTDVRNILALTAIQDTFTGVLPVGGTNQWGHGKVNAYQAVVMAATYRTGINTITNTIDCKLYPNPNTGSFMLDYTAGKEEALTVEVFSLEGKLVLSENWKAVAGSNRKQINLSGMSNGLYFMKVTSATGTSVLPTMVAK